MPIITLSAEKLLRKEFVERAILKKMERDLEEDDPLIRLVRNEAIRKELQETELRLTELLESGQITKAEYVLRHQIIVQRMNDLIETDQKLRCAGMVRIRLNTVPAQV